MKTLTKTLFAALLTGLVLTASAMTTFAANTVEVAAAGKSFNKIWVSGNVKIILSQNDKEGIYVTEDFNPDKTSLISKAGTLYINTMESSQVTIRVSVRDLQRIEAAGAAVVETESKFDVKYLQLFLSQNAKVNLNAKVGDLYTVVKEDATLKMKGQTEKHTLMASNLKNVKMKDLVVLNNAPQGLDLAVKADRMSAVVTK